MVTAWSRLRQCVVMVLIQPKMGLISEDFSEIVGRMAKIPKITTTRWGQNRQSQNSPEARHLSVRACARRCLEVGGGLWRGFCGQWMPQTQVFSQKFWDLIFVVVNAMTADSCALRTSNAVNVRTKSSGNVDTTTKVTPKTKQECKRSTAVASHGGELEGFSPSNNWDLL